MEGLTSNKRPILELKDVSFRCLCFKLLNGMEGKVRRHKDIYFLLLYQSIYLHLHIYVCVHIYHIYFLINGKIVKAKGYRHICEVAANKNELSC